MLVTTRRCGATFSHSTFPLLENCLSLSLSRPFPFSSCVSQIRGISTLQGVCLANTLPSSSPVFLSRDRNFRSKIPTSMKSISLVLSSISPFLRLSRERQSFEKKNFPTLSVEYIKVLRNTNIYTYIYFRVKEKEKNLVETAIEKIFVSWFFSSSHRRSFSILEKK